MSSYLYAYIFQVAFILALPHQNPVRIPPLHHLWHVPYPSHSPFFDHPNNIWLRVQPKLLALLAITLNILFSDTAYSFKVTSAPRCNTTTDLGIALKTNKMKVLFYPMHPEFQKTTAFWKVPRLCPFVLPVRATCRRSKLT
jgi:hypothetical protein